jgi:hypothetical protein
MADEPHDAVKLLLARMESHPEEFRFKEGAYHDRWYNHISAVNTYGNEADKAALAAKTRDIRMAEVHEQVMDELLNGEDRRRKEEEEAEYERKTAAQHMKQQMVTMQSRQAGKNSYSFDLDRYQNQLGQYNQAQATGIVGRSPTSILLDELSEPSYVNQIKKALGIKK